jgi:UDP-GlcNAc:undecaprenyl-phosphate GlcNAc-1-phosphate transferase
MPWWLNIVMISGWIFSLIAFAVVALLMPLARAVALRLGYVDAPGGRKQHDAPIPPIGGLVIFPVFIAVSMLSGADASAHGFLYIGLIIFLVMGAVDDLLPIPALVKFAVQLAVAWMLVVPGGAVLPNLGNLFGAQPFDLGLMAVPFAMAAVVLLVNAINLMDGLDGLAGGIGVVILGWLALASFLAGDGASLLILGPLLGALVGFLVYNMRHPFRAKACVFMGDAGSLSLGLVIAWFSIYLAKQPVPVVQPISVAWILALPIMDTCAQFYRRIREGRHPFSPDRGHFHHHFLQAHWPVAKAAGFILLAGALLGAIGFGALALGLPPIVLTVTWIILLLTHMEISRRPSRYIAILRKLKPVACG